MNAIRCRIPNRSFRRDGVEFAGNAWTFVDEVTPAQKAEPMLLIVEVEGEDDPRLEEALQKPPVIPAPEEPVEETGLRGILITLEAENTRLQEENEDLQGSKQTLNDQLLQEIAGRRVVEGQLADAQEQVRTLQEQVSILEQTNTELGQAYQALLAEKETEAGAEESTSGETTEAGTDTPPAEPQKSDSAPQAESNPAPAKRSK